LPKKLAPLKASRATAATPAGAAAVLRIPSSASPMVDAAWDANRATPDTNYADRNEEDRDDPVAQAQSGLSTTTIVGGRVVYEAAK